jgi:hypothetical protein
VGRAARGEAAEVRAPQPRRAGLGRGEHAGAQLHGVQARVERDVTGDHIADQVAALFVARDGERRRWALTETQPGVQQWRVTA